MPHPSSVAHSPRWSFGRLFRGAPPLPVNEQYEDEVEDESPSPLTPAKHARQDLLSAISAFLLHHDLAISPSNLTLAFEAMSGANPRLGAKIADRLHTGLPITQQWLDAISDIAAHDQEHDASLRMINELEVSLRKFSHTTTEARSVTQQYGDNLSRHRQQIEAANYAEENLLRLRQLTQDMAEKTRSLELSMAEQEGEAKELRQRLAKVKRDAEEDPLTGLPNQRAFKSLMQKEIDAARASSEHLSIAICDIDQFQHINETHGHDTGDRVLKLVAKLLGDMPIEHFHVARHSGAEFALVFRGVSTLEAKDLLDDMRARIVSRQLISRDTNLPLGPVSISAGIANAFAYNDIPLTMRAADTALFYAKKDQKNAVRIALV